MNKPGLVNLNSKQNLQKCNNIVDKIADRYGYKRGDILGKRRTVKHIWPRHTAMYLCRLCGLTFQEIGDIFNKDHGTAINACNNIRNLCDTEPRLAKEFKELREMFNV